MLLTIGTGLFVASEFALVNTDRTELESLAEKGDRGLKLPIRAIKRTSTHLSAAQLGITLTTLLTGFLAEPAISTLLSPWFSSLGLQGDLKTVISTITALVLATLFSFLFGELVPKNMALAVPVKTLKGIIWFQLLFTWIFYYIIMFLNNNGNFFVRKFGVEPREELSGARSAEELSSLVLRSASLGSMEQDTANLLSRTLRLGELNASDVMTPRPKMIIVQRDDTAADVVQQSMASGHSRFPIQGDDVDDIIGVVHLKQAIAVPLQKRAQVPVTALLQDAIKVPETMSLDSLAVALRGKGLQLAIVLDEYGGTSGMVTLEDVIEELIGELDDEHDRVVGLVTVTSDNEVSFSGLKRPDELAEYGIEVPEGEDYDTVSGFVMSELGRIAQLGDQVEMDTGVLEVIRMDGRRIDRLRFVKQVDHG